MTKTVLITLFALMLTACASKRDIASTQENEQFNMQESQHAQMIDGAASRVR